MLNLRVNLAFYRLEEHRVNFGNDGLGYTILSTVFTTNRQ